MATFTFPYTLNNITGHTGYKVLYRVSGTTIFTSYLTSGTTTTISGLTNNYIYDLEVQNINNHDNPFSPIVRAIGFTDPGPLISPTNSTVAFSFANLSYFMSYYTVSVALSSSPGVILQSQTLSSGTTVSGSFSGLLPLTLYNLNITPVAAEFSQLFTYTFTTAESAVCATPTLASAYLTSGAIGLHVTFTSPAILPSGGFSIAYRLRGTNTYASGSIAGTTGVNTATEVVSTYGSYEGFVSSVCGSSADTTSIGAPFGTNAYLGLNAVINLTSGVARFIATVTSLYANPYNTVVSGTFISAVTGSHSYSVTYPAGSTSAVITIPPLSPAANDTVSSYTVTAIAPAFDNGGSIQQFDNVSTPGYFQFYSALTSGVTWNGNPASLPSFTLDRFEISETDMTSNVLGGILLFSWIYDHQFGSGAAPYNTITFEIQDPANNSVMGTVTVSTSPIGLREASVTLVKQVTAITPTNLFHLVGRWSDTSAISTISFYLPVF